MRKPLTALALPLLLMACGRAVAASDRLLPPPAADAAATPGLQTAVLAGGCFWGMEGVFEHVRGVREVVSGYAGGRRADATYDRVSTERTGHAEAVRITFDPRQLSYGSLLRLYFSVAHDPTQLNRQGPDSGPSYRSAIFPQSPEQARVARAYIDQLRSARAFARPIVTTVESGPFFAAESYHQDFMRRNPTYPYIVVNDAPKVRALRRLAPQFYRG